MLRSRFWLDSFYTLNHNTQSCQTPCDYCWWAIRFKTVQVAAVSPHHYPLHLRSTWDKLRQSGPDPPATQTHHTLWALCGNTRQRCAADRLSSWAATPLQPCQSLCLWIGTRLSLISGSAVEFSLKCSSKRSFVSVRRSGQAQRRIT
jgi:hypothetical protein